MLLNTTVDGSTVMSFTPGQRFDTGDDGKDVELRDMNGDGKLDVVVSNNGGNGVDILLNTMAPGSLTPSFAAPLVFSSPGAPWGIAVGDYNGDGTPDVAVASSGNEQHLDPARHRLELQQRRRRRYSLQRAAHRRPRRERCGHRVHHDIYRARCANSDRRYRCADHGSGQRRGLSGRRSCSRTRKRAINCP